MIAPVDPPAGQRIARCPEAAHHPRVPTAPHEQADGLAGGAHRPSRNLHGFLQGRRADESIWAGPEDVQSGRPAADAGPLAFAAVGPRSAPRASESLQLELGRGAAIGVRSDHVEHHLHAGADALDEVGLGHEIGPGSKVEAIGARGAQRRAGQGREGQQAGDHGRQEAAHGPVAGVRMLG